MIGYEIKMEKTLLQEIKEYVLSEVRKEYPELEINEDWIEIKANKYNTGVDVTFKSFGKVESANIDFTL